jgi:acyl-CoA thioesterase
MSTGRETGAPPSNLGGLHVTDWDATAKTLTMAFTVRPEFCHTNSTIAQGGFVTAWMDAAMAHAVLYATDHTETVASLDINVSFLLPVAPGPGRAVARIVRRGKRIAFLAADLYDHADRHAATATSTGMIIPAVQP